MQFLTCKSAHVTRGLSLIFQFRLGDGSTMDARLSSLKRIRSGARVESDGFRQGRSVAKGMFFMLLGILMGLVGFLGKKFTEIIII